MRVSNHTEVNLRIVIDRNIDFLLRLSWASIVLWWVVVRNSLHSLLNEFVSLVLEALAVAVFTSVHTTTKIIILRSGGRRSEKLDELENKPSRVDM